MPSTEVIYEIARLRTIAAGMSSNFGRLAGKENEALEAWIRKLMKLDAEEYDTEYILENFEVLVTALLLIDLSIGKQLIKLVVLWSHVESINGESQEGKNIERLALLI